MNQCNHTTQAIDSSGQPTGSWMIEQREHKKHIICRVCGKVYGQIASSQQDYLKQQQRRACPGCGEEPFLG